MDHEELRGITPTREGLKQKCTIFRTADGRIAEHWGVFDQLAMLAQLGAFGG